MNTITKLPLLTVLLFTLITAKPLLSAAESDPVLDIDGEQLLTGRTYYIVSAIRGLGGGSLSLDRVGETTCPLDVVQEESDSNYGLPLTFLSLNNQKKKEKKPAKGIIIRESTNLLIRFNVTNTSCMDYTTIWRFDNYDEEKNQVFVRTGGLIGDPLSMARIDKLEVVKSERRWYRIVTCPFTQCGDIGVYHDEESQRRRLALSRTPLIVYFTKADGHGRTARSDQWRDGVVAV